MKTNVISIRNAKLKTVTVTINSLTVDGRQVTLAIFRQLIEEDLINEGGGLNGVPWGTVNYHPSKDCYGRHVHVVWQKGQELRRATVQFYADRNELYSDVDYLNVLARDIMLGRCDRPEIRKEDSDTFILERKGVTIKFLCERDDSNYWVRCALQRDIDEDDRKEVEEVAGKIKGNRLKLERLLDEEIDQFIARRKRWKASINMIKQLPQLFIAV